MRIESILDTMEYSAAAAVEAASSYKKSFCLNLGRTEKKTVRKIENEDRILFIFHSKVDKHEIISRSNWNVNVVLAHVHHS